MSRDRRAKCRCPGVRSQRRDAAAEAENQAQNGPGIAMKPLHEVGEVVAPRRSRAEGEMKASAKTRAKSEDSAPRRVDRRPGVSVAGTVAVGLAAAHCWDRMDGSCSGIRRQGTDAAESGTGRCMAERPS